MDGTDAQQAGIRVHFVLPKGAYATTVLGAVMAIEDRGAPQAGKEGQSDGDD
jgi:tRNA(Glu) U13 pseudouridine synthase TruD